LIADHRHAKELKELQRHVGLSDRIRLLFVENTAAKRGEPSLLVLG